MFSIHCDWESINEARPGMIVGMDARFLQYSRDYEFEGNLYGFVGKNPPSLSSMFVVEIFEFDERNIVKVSQILSLHCLTMFGVYKVIEKRNANIAVLQPLQKYVNIVFEKEMTFVYRTERKMRGHGRILESIP